MSTAGGQIYNGLRPLLTVAPLVEGKAPVLFHEFHGARVVAVLILLIALLRGNVLADGLFRLVPARELQRLVDLLRHAERVRLKVLKLHLNQVALGNKVLVGLVLMVKLGVDAEDILLQFFLRDVLQAERLDGVGEERARALKHRVGVAHQVDELSVGEHLHQFCHAARVGRVLGEELRAARVPKRNLDEFRERFLPHFQFCGVDVLKQHVLVAVFQLVLRVEPKVVVRVGHHVGEGELLLLRQVDGEVHIVGRALVGHEPRHVFLKERLPEHHEVGEDRLIGGAIAEMLVAREHVVHESRARAPMSEDKHRRMFQRLVGEEFLVAAVLNGRER